MEKLVYNSSESNPCQILQSLKQPVREYQISLWGGSLDDLNDDDLELWNKKFEEDED